MEKMRYKDWVCLAPGEFVKRVFGIIDMKLKVTFISTVLIGLVAHMYMLTNKLPNYDDSYFTFELGLGSSLGRWFLDYMRGTSLRLQGNFSMPWLNGLIAIMLIAASACIICATLEVKDQLNQILIGGVMVSFPAVTALFTFMFMASTSGLAIFLLSCAAFVTSRYKWGGIPGSVLIAFSLGIYQAYWGIASTVLLSLLIIHCMDVERKIRNIIEEAVRYFLTLVLSFVIYFSLTKFLLWKWDVKLSQYQGVNQMGEIDPSKIPENIGYAYKNFFGLCYKPLWSVNDDRIIRLLFGGLFIISIIAVFVKLFQKKNGSDLLHKLGVVFFVILFPISVNIIYLMVGDPNKTYIYTIMVYTVVFSVILPVVLIDKITVNVRAVWGIGLSWIAVILTVGLIAGWIQVNNRTYLAMELRHESVKTYFTTLLTQIKQVDEYDPEYPVAMIGRIEDPSLPSFRDFGGKRVMGVANAEPTGFVNNYENSRIRFLQYYCGYQFKPAEDIDKIKTSNEFDEMAIYPKAGSIKVIDGVVTVKFSDE